MLKKSFAVNSYILIPSLLMVFSANSMAAEKEWSAELGLGNDSNIYRAPGESYIDYAKSCDVLVDVGCQTRIDGADHPLVDPVVQSGGFAEVDLKGGYEKPLNKNNNFIAEYNFDARFYLDSKYNNANQSYHKLELGNEYIFNTAGKKEDSLYAGLLIGHKKKLYLDRDTGDEQEFSNTDVSDRYTYDVLGAEVQLKKRTGKVKYKLKAVYQQKDYLDEVVISEYDHDYYLIAGDADFDLSKANKLSVAYDYYVYDYSDRPSRNAQGNLFSSSPKREYQYSRLKATIRHRFSKSLKAYLDYERKEREDQYLGYDDYTKDLVKARIRYNINHSYKLKLSLAYWERDYPNAYAFDNDVLGIQKQYDGMYSSVNLERQWGKHKSVLMGFKYKDDNSTDLRYDYDRYQLSVGVSWQY